MQSHVLQHLCLTAKLFLTSVLDLNISPKLDAVIRNLHYLNHKSEFLCVLVSSSSLSLSVEDKSNSLINLI